MLTEQLFEQWNFDHEMIVGKVHAVLGPCDIFIGGSLADDLGTSGSDVDLYCIRLAVESALDAALASRGMVNPNSKWRVPLAQRVQLVDPQFPDLETLLGGLFPDPRAPGEAVRRCLDTAAHCLRVVTDDGFLASFPIVAEAVELLDAAVPGPDGDG